MKIFPVFLALLFLQGQPVLAEKIPGSDFRYENWNGGAYTYDDTGVFSHCVIAADYVSGDTLLFSVNRDATVTLGVANPELGLRAEQQFPVALFIDRRQPFYGTAEAISDSVAIFVLNDFDRAMTAIKKGFVLKVNALGRTGTYNLTGTFHALELARQCALANFDYVATPAEVPLQSQIDQSVLYQISTTMIAEVGAVDFRYLSEAEAREITTNQSVFWAAESSGVRGGAIAVAKGSLNQLRDTDGADMQFLAGLCGDGDFASSSRNLSLDNVEARELRLVCSLNDTTAEVYATKMLLGDVVLYSILAFNKDFEEEPNRSSSSINGDVAHSLANYVVSNQ